MKAQTKKQINPFLSQRITPLINVVDDDNDIKMISPKRHFQFSRPNIITSTNTNTTTIDGKTNKGALIEVKKQSNKLQWEEDIGNICYTSKDPYWRKRELYTKQKLDSIRQSQKDKERSSMRDRPLLSHNSKLIANKLRSVSVNKSRIEQMNFDKKTKADEHKKISLKNKPKLIQKKTVDSLYQRKLNEINIEKEKNEIPIKSLLGKDEDNECDNEQIKTIEHHQKELLTKSMILMDKASKSNARVMIPYQTFTNSSVQIPHGQLASNNNQCIPNQNQSHNQLSQRDANINSLNLIRNQLCDYYNNKPDKIESHHHHLTTEQRPRYQHQIHHEHQYQHQEDFYDNPTPNFNYNQSNSNHPSLSYIDNYHRNSINTNGNINSNLNISEGIENQVVNNITSSTILKESNPILKYREENNRRLQDLENMKLFTYQVHQSTHDQMFSHNNQMKPSKDDYFVQKQKEQLKTNLIQNEYSKQAMHIDYFNEKLKQNEMKKEFIVSQMGNKESNKEGECDNDYHHYKPQLDKNSTYNYCLGNGLDGNNGVSLCKNSI